MKRRQFVTTICAIALLSTHAPLPAFAKKNSFLTPRQCYLNSEIFEREIASSAIAAELQAMTHETLLEAYSTQSLSGRLEVVKNIMDVLRPYRKGLGSLTHIRKHQAVLDGYKAREALIELGMEKAEAKKTVDHLLKNPNAFQKLTSVLTSLTAATERQNANRYLITTTVILAGTIIFGPGTFTNIAVFLKTGIYTPIPIVNWAEGGTILGLLLYGSTGWRIAKNAVNRINEVGIERKIFTPEVIEGGKRPISEISARDVEILFRFATKASVGFKRRILRPIGKAGGTLLQAGRRFGGMAMNSGEATASGIKRSAEFLHMMVLEISLMIAIAKNNSVNEAMTDALRLRDYFYSIPAQDYKGVDFLKEIET